MTICKACQERNEMWKTAASIKWPGSDPKCGFQSGAFAGINNWNCATVGFIRELAEVADNPKITLTRTKSNQNYSTIDLTNLTTVHPAEDEDGYMVSQPICLWVGWYRSRGHTEGIYLMSDYLPPRPPTEDECIRILKHYKSPTNMKEKLMREWVADINAVAGRSDQCTF